MKIGFGQLFFFFLPWLAFHNTRLSFGSLYLAHDSPAALWTNHVAPDSDVDVGFEHRLDLLAIVVNDHGTLNDALT